MCLNNELNKYFKIFCLALHLIIQIAGSLKAKDLSVKTLRLPCFTRSSNNYLLNAEKDFNTNK